METRRFADFELSRLMLGTVQFGMPYGVANRAGQPGYSDVLAMVAAAIEGGVNCFDTAAAYGNSEEVLGRALHELGVTEKVVIVTKVLPLTPAEMADETLAEQAIEKSLRESQRRLRLDVLPIVLFHRESDAVHLAALQRLRSKGLLKHAGVSCDNQPGPAAGFVGAGNASALQIPGNVLDRRHQESGLFQKAAAQGVGVFMRSVYLQGLLVMPEEAIPPALSVVIPVRRRLAEIAAAAGMTLAELAVRYLLSQPGVTCVLAGVDTVAQIQENVALFGRGTLSADTLKAIDAAVPALPEPVLTPSQWPNLCRG